MRLPLHVPAGPRRKPAGTKPTRAARPCVDPQCKNPTGGYVAAGRSLPERRHGFCKACFRRRERGAAKTGLKACGNPACKDPMGGKPKRKGLRPSRLHGLCLECYERQRSLVRKHERTEKG